MKRAVITILLCIMNWYLGFVLILSWQEHKYIEYENNFAEALNMIFYGGWCIVAFFSLFFPMFIIMIRHK